MKYENHASCSAGRLHRRSPQTDSKLKDVRVASFTTPRAFQLLLGFVLSDRFHYENCRSCTLRGRPCPRRERERRKVKKIVIALVVAALALVLVRLFAGQQETTQSARSQPELAENYPEPSSDRLPSREKCDQKKCSECPSGTRGVIRPGQCCPRCEPFSQAECDAGQEEYESLTRPLMDRLVSCAEDSECMIASFSDPCGARCPMSLNKKELGGVVEEIKEVAAKHCQACGTPSFHCPRPVTGRPICTQGKCTTDSAVTSPEPPSR